MSAKEIANENWKVLITPKSGSIPGSQQAITWILMKAPKEKVDKGAILTQQISWVVSPNVCSFPGFPVHTGSIGVVPIMATAAKTKCGKMPVMRAGDKGSCSCMFSNPSSGATTSAMCDFEIIYAGQATIKGA